MEITLQMLNEKLDSISRLTLIGAKPVLNLEETILFTGFSKGHIYRLTSERKIPFYKKGRKLFFKKTDIENWMLETSFPTNKEVQSQATTYTALNRRKH